MFKQLLKIKSAKHQSGFSLIEMLVASAIVLFISAASYKVLTDQGRAQKDSVSNQKLNIVTLTALDRFKKDVSLVDPIWITFGIASVYPHQGYGFGNNFYTDTMNRSEGLNDAVTFLRRDVEKSMLNATAYSHSFTPGGTDIRPLFDEWIRLGLPSNQIQAGDWVLVYEPGKYVLGIATDVATLPDRIKIRRPLDSEIEESHINIWGRSSGFTTKAGVAPASFDWTGSNTVSTEDNGIAFAKGAKIQVVIPVTYELDWATSDGETHGNGNSYVLDDDGNQKKMVVRTSFNGSAGRKREYVVEADQMGLTYDVLRSSYGGSTGLTGYEDGDVVKDVGRSSNSELQFVNLSVSPNSTEGFISTSRILSVRMILGTDIETQNSEDKKFNQMKVAIDPNLQNDRYQDTANIDSYLTANLQIAMKEEVNSTFNDQIGKPLYLVNSNGDEVLVPESTFEVKNDGTMGPRSVGEIYIYDTEGCAVNPGTTCKPTTNSKIKFNMASEDGMFFPNTIMQTTLPDGTRRIIVGGVAMNGHEGSSVRTPGIGIITLGPTETLKDKLLNNQVTGGSCNISGCEWHAIDNTALPGLVDTANIAVDRSNPNKIYVATMTKQSGASSRSKIFSAVWNGSTYNFSEVADVIGTEDSKVVTAISDKTIFSKQANAAYLPVCVSKKMSASCGGECLVKAAPSNINSVQRLVPLQQTAPLVDEDDNAFGEIQLIPVSSTTTNQFVDEGAGPQVVRLTQHNYRCSSLSLDKKNNLIVGGRLTVQSISYNDMENAINGDPMENFMYLDEVTNVSGSSTAYADYFQVEPKTYANNTDPQYIGWLTGLSTVHFPNGEFGMVNANKFRLAAGYGANTGNTEEKDFSNAGIFRGQLGGMDARVVATIQTNSQNYNASAVSASYAVAVSMLPQIYVPGKFYKRPGHSRTTPTPLPAMSPSMSEASWFKLYQDMLTPQQETGLNSGMPVFGEGMQAVTNCKNTRPKTCL